ncbi:Kelch-type beta propeller [Corchorus olitorius]|uniref:Kelch-type beta propeller n=1 Tax=Corchorus olitorius TaxID=93759 RepID=A0A1R3K1D8_9ROSI|nr:Kelch-type beta propeller [Corchorus olitorius]
MAHSHLGMVTDGRYIYVVTGQYGSQCRGPTAHTFVLDTETKTWQDLPLCQCLGMDQPLNFGEVPEILDAKSKRLHQSSSMAIG